MTTADEKFNKLRKRNRKTQDQYFWFSVVLINISKKHSLLIDNCQSVKFYGKKTIWFLYGTFWSDDTGATDMRCVPTFAADDNQWDISSSRSEKVATSVGGIINSYLTAPNRRADIGWRTCWKVRQNSWKPPKRPPRLGHAPNIVAVTLHTAKSTFAQLIHLQNGLRR